METRENHKIIYNGGTELPLVSEPYPLVKSKEREQVVLQMYADASLVTAIDIELLVTNAGDITHYTQAVAVDEEGTETTGEWKPKVTYSGYACGADGLVYGYADGRYSIQLLRQDRLATKVDGLEAAVQQVQADTEYLAIMAGADL